MESTVRLSGWAALLVGVAIVGAFGWGWAQHVRPVPAPARDALQAWLVEDYSRATPGETAQVSLDRLAGHGWPDFLIVRAEVTSHHGGRVPQQAVRYLGVSQQRNGAWRVTGESSAWNYWWALVPAPRSGSS